VAVLALASIVALAANQSGDPVAKASPAALPWAVDTCVRLTATPSPYPSNLDYGGRRMWDRQRSYGTVVCTDPAAEGRIIAQGAEYSRGDTIAGRPVPSRCPDDTDFEMHVSDARNLGSRIWCVRNLKPPHVADPGQGGGRIVAGDCVLVNTSDYTRRNDRIRELPCTETTFAAVLATAPTAAGCPPAALSRLPDPAAPGTVLCLGSGTNTVIIPIGECVDWPSNMFVFLQRRPCGDQLAYRLAALADTEQGCRRPLSPFTVNGYDRFVCLRSPSD
jgi:hypothetical protein